MRIANQLVSAAVLIALCVADLGVRCPAQTPIAQQDDSRYGVPYPAAAPAPLSQDAAGAPSAAPTYTATIDGCQIIARIDNQVVLACEVLWFVNQLLEANRDKIPPEEYEQIREHLMKREVASLIDRKLLYNEFRRSDIPAESLTQIEKSLIEPFQERELPLLYKQLKVNSPSEVERELVRLGSSMADARRAFNEKAIAGEWLRSKVKINEEVSPDEMWNYYQAHLAEYEFPTQARWEELMVRKQRFSDSQQAYAALAQMGNEVWKLAESKRELRGPAFAEVAQAKSDGLTADKGGLHDWTTKGALKFQVIDEALFTLAVGQMSPILETDTAFHIVRVLERKEAGRKPFTEVQGKIRDDLKEERFQTAVNEYLGTLRKQAKIWTVFTGPTTADALAGRTATDDPQRR